MNRPKRGKLPPVALVEEMVGPHQPGCVRVRGHWRAELLWWNDNTGQAGVRFLLGDRRIFCTVLSKNIVDGIERLHNQLPLCEWVQGPPLGWQAGCPELPSG